MVFQESRRRVAGFIALLLPIGWLTCQLGRAATVESPEQVHVRQVAASLDQWLIDQPHGESWREFLLLSRLSQFPNDSEGLGLSHDVQRRLEMVRESIEEARFMDLNQALLAWQAIQPPLSLEELREQALAARSLLRPVSPEDIARAQTQLQSDVRQLDRMLSGYGQRGAEWREYLLWDELERQIAQPNIDPDDLFPVWERFSGHFAGLGLPEFASTTRSLRTAIEKADALEDQDFKEELSGSLEAIASGLSELAESGAVDMDLLNLRITQLERLGQVPDFTAAARSHFQQPNFVVRVSAPLVAAGFADRVNRTEPITDCILGTSIRGTGHTDGWIDVKLRPNANRAEIETRFHGINFSNNVGRNGPAIIYSDGQTSFVARNRIAISDAGFVAGGSRARANTQTSIKGTSSTSALFGGIVSNVAYKRAQESRGQTQRIASARAEVRIQRRMDEETGTLISDANRRYKREFRRPLSERGVLPQSIRFSTTADHIHISAVQATTEQLSAADRPSAQLAPSDIAMEIHESLLNNTLQTLFGGRTMQEKEVDELAARFREKEAAKRFESQGSEEPWTITFAERRPISVAFREGLIRMTLRADSLASTERSADRWQISATYALETSPEGTARLVRQGDLAILPIRLETRPDDRMTTAEAALLTPLRRRFERVFEPEIVLEPLKFDGRWGQRVGALALSAGQSDGGWLSLAFNRLKRSGNAVVQSN